MIDIIQQLHKAILAGKHDVIEFIIKTDYDNQRHVEIVTDERIMEYIYSCENVVTVNYVAKLCLFKKLEKERILDNIMMNQCIAGNTDVVKKLLTILYVKRKTNIIDRHHNNEIYFRTACEYGHLALVKLLMAKKSSPVQINILNNDAFRKACINNHVDVAKWLYFNSPEKIPIEMLTDIYNISNDKNNTEIIEWLNTIHIPKIVKINAYDIHNIKAKNNTREAEIKIESIEDDDIKSLPPKQENCLPSHRTMAIIGFASSLALIMYATTVIIVVVFG
jgi:hypothetical protein